MGIENVLIIFCAKYLVAVPVLVLLGLLAYGVVRGNYRLLWLSIISLPLAYGLARLAGHFFYNPRPFMVGNFTPLISHAADNGFPSDHMLIAATIAMVVLYFSRPLGIALWVIAFVIGFARVFAGIHHTLDIFGSAGIAVVSVVIAHYFLHYLRRKNI